MTLRNLFIFRHGETDWNREGRFQGHIDIPMNENGRAQARALGPVMLQHRIEAILSSDLCRAHETAKIIAAHVSVPIFVTERLREAHLGEAQGLTRVEIEKKFGKETLRRWRSGLPVDAEVAYSGGESARIVSVRVFNAIREFLIAHPFQRVGISTHGGVIRRVMERILPEGHDFVPISNGIFYQIQYDVARDVWSMSNT